MALITAPDGVILALLAFEASAPIVPDETAELWLREQALIEDTQSGVTELTGRGRAYIRMINSTPLPVKVERWDDPRGESTPPPAPAAAFDPIAMATAMALALKGAGLVGAAPQPKSPGVVTGLPFSRVVAAPTPIVAPAAEPAAPARELPPAFKPKAVRVVNAIPPDFREVLSHWATIPAGQWPSELQSDQDVTVIFADGRVSATRAVQSIIWEHKGTADDVIAYKLGNNDTMIQKG